MSELMRMLIWDPKTLATVETLAVESMKAGATALAMLLGQTVKITDVQVTRLLLANLAEALPEPGAEAVGVFLLAEGDLRGQFLLLLSMDEALRLAEIMLGYGEGTLQTLDGLARSALGEVGNQLSALFINSAVRTTGRTGRPTPPAVLVEMSGALVQLWLTANGRLDDHLVLVDAAFNYAGRQALAHFWVLPEFVTLRALARVPAHD